METITITRKIEVTVNEVDKDLRKEYFRKLYDNRDVAVRVANMAVSHLFVLDNTMPYLSAEAKETIEYLGCSGQKATKQNAPYVAASEAFKGKANMNMVSCVLQNTEKMYKEDRKKGMWDKSLRSYKANMPVPFKSNQFSNLHFEDYEYQDKEGKTVKSSTAYFSLIGVPFKMRFGRDRSNNRLIVEKVISGEYGLCTSSIKFEDKKMFLLLCVCLPKKKVNLDEKKTLYAYLDVMNPIVCTCDINAAKEKWFEIGTAEEFNYRRRQIQEAVRRCQINNRYSVGGHGRKKKCQALERWHDKEKNYVDTKLHTYSKMLVDLAVKHRCGNIVLMNQKQKEEKAKGDKFVLRNWSYFGLKEKISYKCKMVGIKLQSA